MSKQPLRSSFSWKLEDGGRRARSWRQRAASLNELLRAVEGHRGLVPGTLRPALHPRQGAARRRARLKLLLEAYSGKEIGCTLMKAGFSC